MEDIDIWRSADVMIKRCSESAATEAGLRADQLLDEGDIDGQRAWLRIVEVIKELQAVEPEGRTHEEVCHALALAKPVHSAAKISALPFQAQK